MHLPHALTTLSSNQEQTTHAQHKLDKHPNTARSPTQPLISFTSSCLCASPWRRAQSWRVRARWSAGRSSVVVRHFRPSFRSFHCKKVTSRLHWAHTATTRVISARPTRHQTTSMLHRLTSTSMSMKWSELRWVTAGFSVWEMRGNAKVTKKYHYQHFLKKAYGFCFA